MFRRIGKAEFAVWTKAEPPTFIASAPRCEAGTKCSPGASTVGVYAAPRQPNPLVRTAYQDEWLEALSRRGARLSRCSS